MPLDRNTLRVGDRVINSNTEDRNHGRMATVTHVRDDSFGARYDNDINEGGSYGHVFFDLVTSTEQPRQFQIGDRVRIARTRTDGSGVASIGREGVIARLNMNFHTGSLAYLDEEQGFSVFLYRLDLVEETDTPVSSPPAPVVTTTPIRRSQESVKERLAEYRALPQTGYSALVIEQLEWVLQ